MNKRLICLPLCGLLMLIGSALWAQPQPKPKSHETQNQHNSLS